MSEDGTYVSSQWRDTSATALQLCKENGWTRFNHQYVNHSTNEATTTTVRLLHQHHIGKTCQPPIDLAKGHGGNLPRHNGRATWTVLLKEWHGMYVTRESSVNDYGHTRGIPLKTYKLHVAKTFQRTLSTRLRRALLASGRESATPVSQSH